MAAPSLTEVLAERDRKIAAIPRKPGWLGIPEALDLVGKSKSMPPGPTISLLRTAAASGEVRTEYVDIPGGAAKYAPELVAVWEPLGAGVWPDAVIELKSECITADGKRFRVQIAKSDLQYFLAMVPPPAHKHSVSELSLLQPPYDRSQAEFILAGLKRGGNIKHRPSREEAQEMLQPRFSTNVSRDEAEAIVKKLWGDGKRGPRDSRPREIRETSAR